jgi:hypothetical protein
MTFKFAAPALTAVLAILVTVIPPLAADGETLANAHNATAIYTDSTAALAGGYTLLTDAAGIACIDQPGAGAMGVHYVNGALIQAGTLDPARPQALVYEVQSNGELRLGALEYVVFQAGWDAGHSSPPMLFGQKFMLTPAGNGFGLPAFYSLHTWIWKRNPAGTFEQWNPQVRCAGQNAGIEMDELAADNQPMDMAPMSDPDGAMSTYSHG